MDENKLEQKSQEYTISIASVLEKAFMHDEHDLWKMERLIGTNKVGDTDKDLAHEVCVLEQKEKESLWISAMGELDCPIVLMGIGSTGKRQQGWQPS